MSEYFSVRKRKSKLSDMLPKDSDSNSATASPPTRNNMSPSEGARERRTGIDFSPGVRIEANDYTKRWYPSKILEVNPRKKAVKIHFERWSSRFDEWLPMDSPRIRPAAQIKVVKKRDRKFKVGNRVMASWKNSKKYPATVTAVLPEDMYEVLFFDGFKNKLSSSKLTIPTEEELKRGDVQPPPRPPPLFTGPTEIPLDLGTKEDRRQKKKKFDFKELFHVKKRKLSGDADDLYRNISPKLEMNAATSDNSYSDAVNTNKSPAYTGSSISSTITSPSSYLDSTQPSPRHSGVSVENTKVHVYSGACVSDSEELDTVIVNCVNAQSQDELVNRESEINSDDDDEVIMVAVDIPTQRNPFNDVDTVTILQNRNSFVNNPDRSVSPNKTYDKNLNGNGVSAVPVVVNNSQMEVVNVKSNLRKPPVIIKCYGRHKTNLRPVSTNGNKTDNSDTDLSVADGIQQFRQEMAKCHPVINNLSKKVKLYDEGIIDTGLDQEEIIEEFQLVRSGNNNAVRIRNPLYPEGWSKKAVQRQYGLSAGKWDVYIDGPDGRRFRSRNDIKMHFQEYKIDLNVDVFAFHLAPKMLEILSTRKGSTQPKQRTTSVHHEKATKRIVKRIRRSVGTVSSSASLTPSPVTTPPWSTPVHSSVEPITCPKEGCGKSFRKENLLQMHVKHYHPEFSDLIGRAPDVAELAYARTIGDYDFFLPSPSYKPKFIPSQNKRQQRAQQLTALQQRRRSSPVPILSTRTNRSRTSWSLSDVKTEQAVSPKIESANSCSEPTIGTSVDTPNMKSINNLELKSIDEPKPMCLPKSENVTQDAESIDTLKTECVEAMDIIPADTMAKAKICESTADDTTNEISSDVVDNADFISAEENRVLEDNNLKPEHFMNTTIEVRLVGKDEPTRTMPSDKDALRTSCIVGEPIKIVTSNVQDTPLTEGTENNKQIETREPKFPLEKTSFDISGEDDNKVENEVQNKSSESESDSNIESDSDEADESDSVDETDSEVEPEAKLESIILPEGSFKGAVDFENLMSSYHVSKSPLVNCKLAPKSKTPKENKKHVPKLKISISAMSSPTKVPILMETRSRRKSHVIEGSLKVRETSQRRKSDTDNEAKITEPTTLSSTKAKTSVSKVTSLPTTQKLSDIAEQAISKSESPLSKPSRRRTRSVAFAPDVVGEVKKTEKDKNGVKRRTMSEYHQKLKEIVEEEDDNIPLAILKKEDSLPSTPTPEQFEFVKPSPLSISKHNPSEIMLPTIRLKKLNVTTDSTGRVCWLNPLESLVHPAPVKAEEVSNEERLLEPTTEAPVVEDDTQLVDEFASAEDIANELGKTELINCLCHVEEEDGLMIQCEVCLCWQHGTCCGIEFEDQVPEKYICCFCEFPLKPRKSRHYAYDQEWRKEGKLASLCDDDDDCLGHKLDQWGMKQASAISAEANSIKEMMHSCRVKLSIASNPDHPKLYLWSEKWESTAVVVENTNSVNINSEVPTTSQTLSINEESTDKTVNNKVFMNPIFEHSYALIVPLQEESSDNIKLMNVNSANVNANVNSDDPLANTLVQPNLRVNEVLSSSEERLVCDNIPNCSRNGFLTNNEELSKLFMSVNTNMGLVRTSSENKLDISTDGAEEKLSNGLQNGFIPEVDWSALLPNQDALNILANQIDTSMVVDLTGCELEQLARTMEEQLLKLTVNPSDMAAIPLPIKDPQGPVPEALINMSDCQVNLLDHIQDIISTVTNRVEFLNSCVKELEVGFPTELREETQENTGRFRHTIDMLLDDIKQIDHLPEPATEPVVQET